MAKSKGTKKAATKKGRKKSRSRKSTSPSKKAKNEAPTQKRGSTPKARGTGAACLSAEQLIEGLKRITDSIGGRIGDAKKLFPKWKEELKRETPRLRRIMKRVKTQAKQLQEKIKRFLE